MCERARCDPIQDNLYSRGPKPLLYSWVWATKEDIQDAKARLKSSIAHNNQNAPDEGDVQRSYDLIKGYVDKRGLKRLNSRATLTQLLREQAIPFRAWGPAYAQLNREEYML